MRSAPTLKIWMTPFSSVAMLEKLALFRIAFCRAPVLSTASLRRSSVLNSMELITGRLAAFAADVRGFMVFWWQELCLPHPPEWGRRLLSCSGRADSIVRDAARKVGESL